ncbi:hypothetical protein BCT84_02690 [Vibrio breoganii]|nr:hypothetical protein BCT84_02690 [Vibrio breoganii]
MVIPIGSHGEKYIKHSLITAYPQARFGVLVNLAVLWLQNGVEIDEIKYENIDPDLKYGRGEIWRYSPRASDWILLG